MKKASKIKLCLKKKFTICCCFFGQKVKNSLFKTKKAPPPQKNMPLRLGPLQGCRNPVSLLKGLIRFPIFLYCKKGE